jgi:trehalose/maltose hydrolase-like predicted phosphorylase
VTVANGMIGIVSSPEPFKVKDVVLAGAYDLYGRGRVSNFLRSFNLLNMTMDIDGRRVDARSVSNMVQELDMKQASFTTSFSVGDKAEISYTYYSLRCEKRYCSQQRQRNGSAGCVKGSSELL